MASPSPLKSELLERGLALYRDKDEAKDQAKGKRRSKGEQTALAAAIGMDRTRLNRLINGKARRLGITNCLKLATLIDQLPHVVLRVFGWTVEADVLQRVYATPPFTQKQIKVAELYGKATPKQRRLPGDIQDALPLDPAPRHTARR